MYTVKKDGRVAKLNDDTMLAAYINSGWKRETDKKASKNETKDETANKTDGELGNDGSGDNSDDNANDGSGNNDDDDSKSEDCCDPDCEDKLRARAAELGIKLHHFHGVTKIRELIAEKEKGLEAK